MKRCRNMLSRWFHPRVEADPKLVSALDAVDAAGLEFERALEEAHACGLFPVLQLPTKLEPARARLRRLS